MFATKPALNNDPPNRKEYISFDRPFVASTLELASHYAEPDGRCCVAITDRFRSIPIRSSPVCIVSTRAQDTRLEAIESNPASSCSICHSS